MNKRNEAPLLTKISEHIKTKPVGFHTPGHLQGKGCYETFQVMANENILGMDLTEIPGLDNLRTPTGCIAESQKLAAEAFGALKTYYLANGSTLGLQAALLAVNKPGEKIIIPRNAHVSIANGLILSGGMPVLAPVEVEREWGFPLGVCLEEMQSIRALHPEAAAVLLVNPEYRGTGQDISLLLELVRGWQIPVIIDEAHGAHLYFQSDIPLSAQRQKADIVVHGAHKTLAALTQASLLHVNQLKWDEPIKNALNILQTTSPSYLLLASLDGLQAKMRADGVAEVGQSMELAEHFRFELKKITGYSIFETKEHSGWYQDKTKILLSAAELGLTGWKLAEILQQKYNIAVEMSDYYYVLFIVHGGHSQTDVNKVTTALQSIKKETNNLPLKPWPGHSLRFEAKQQPVVTLREAYYWPKENVPLEQAVGRIAGEQTVAYPPGIPLVWPGEIIREDHIQYIKEMRALASERSECDYKAMASVLTEG